jgi:hypothetical protein
MRVLKIDVAGNIVQSPGGAAAGEAGAAAGLVVGVAAVALAAGVVGAVVVVVAPPPPPQADTSASVAPESIQGLINPSYLIWGSSPFCAAERGLHTSPRARPRQSGYRRVVHS